MNQGSARSIILPIPAAFLSLIPLTSVMRIVVLVLCFTCFKKSSERSALDHPSDRSGLLIF